jgi:hypothetical protein
MKKLIILMLALSYCVSSTVHAGTAEDLKRNSKNRFGGR